MGLVVLEVLFLVVGDEVLEEICDFLRLCYCLPAAHTTVRTACKKSWLFSATYADAIYLFYGFRQH